MDFRNRDRHDAAQLHRRLINLQDGEAQIVSDLVAAGGRLDVYGDIDGMTPFHHAAKNGQAKVVAAMIAAGARLHGGAGIKATPLHVAAESGHVEVCRVLIEAGASTRLVDGQRRTPMLRAADGGQGEVVHFFLGDPRVRPSRQELAETLKALSMTSAPQYVDEVLDRIGASAELVNVGFYCALRAGNTDVAKRLVERGADWRNPPGGRSLMQLTKRDAQDLKRYLRSLQTGEKLGAAMDGQPAGPDPEPKRDSFGAL